MMAADRWQFLAALGPEALEEKSNLLYRESMEVVDSRRYETSNLGIRHTSIVFCQIPLVPDPIVGP